MRKTQDKSINFSPRDGDASLKGAAARRLLAAGQCFLFSILNDSSSLYERQKGQSLIDTRGSRLA